MTKKKTPTDQSENGGPAAAKVRQRGKTPWLNRMEPHLLKLHALAVAELERTRKDESADIIALRSAMAFVEDVESHPSWTPQPF